MRRNFNIRMALTNIKNNQNIYLPYFMAASLIVMLFYSLRSVSFMVANSTAAGGVTMSAMLQMSSWICGILSLVILFYVNSFIMKRRKKEFGLYSILGMEKRHIALVMAWEVLITGAIGIFCGIVLGRCSASFCFATRGEAWASLWCGRGNFAAGKTSTEISPTCVGNCNKAA